MGYVKNGNYDRNGDYIPQKDACDYCEGTCFHFGKECGGCEGTGKKIVQKQLEKVYRAKQGMKINQQKL